MIPEIIAAIAPHLVSVIVEDEKKEEGGGQIKDEIMAVLSDVLGAEAIKDEPAALATLRADPEKFVRVQERLAVIEAQHAAREAKSMAEARAANAELSKHMKGMAFIPAMLAVISIGSLVYLINRVLDLPPEKIALGVAMLATVSPLAYAAFNHILGSSIGSKLKTGIGGGLGKNK